MPPLPPGPLGPRIELPPGATTPIALNMPQFGLFDYAAKIQTRPASIRPLLQGVKPAPHLIEIVFSFRREGLRRCRHVHKDRAAVGDPCDIRRFQRVAVERWAEQGLFAKDILREVVNNLFLEARKWFHR
jgi:hypothetical protein